MKAAKMKRAARVVPEAARDTTTNSADTTLASERAQVWRALETAPSHSTGETVNILRADSINPEPIDWIWKEWLAQGKLHILAGTAGTGKTTLALAMAATITTGRCWPDGTRAPIGDVVMWSGEDDPCDTLIPRLMAMEADRSKFHFVGAVGGGSGPRAFDPASDVRLLSEQFDRCGNVRLLIVDPIVSAVAADSHKNSEVRRSLQPLVDLAAKHGCALIGITHYSKGTGGRDPLERVTGSLAFGALARLVLGTAKPMVAGEPRRLVRAKSNIGPDGGGFEYALEEIEVPGHAGLVSSRVVWGKPIDGTAHDLLTEIETDPDDDSDRGATDEAAEWLKDRLTGSPALASEIKKEALHNGFAWRTVQRARKGIGAVHGRHGFGKGAVRIWALTPEELTDAKKAIDAKNATHNFLASMDDLAPMVEPVAVPDDTKSSMRAKSPIGANSECVAPTGANGSGGRPSPFRYRRIPVPKSPIFDTRLALEGRPRDAECERHLGAGEEF